MIIPTILEKDFEEVKKKILIIDDEAPFVQIDVVDGKVCKGETFLDIERLNSVETSAFFEIDLMVENPIDYLERDVSRAVRFCAYSKGKNLSGFVDKAKEKGLMVGLSIDSKTSADVITPYLDKLSFVEFLGVEPGAQGRNFIPEVLDRIKEFKRNFPKVNIQVDGGIKTTNILGVMEAGADDLVVGSEIFGSSNPIEKYIELKNTVYGQNN